MVVTNLDKMEFQFKAPIQLPQVHTNLRLNLANKCSYFEGKFEPFCAQTRGPLLKEGNSVAMLSKEMLCFDLF